MNKVGYILFIFVGICFLFFVSCVRTPVTIEISNISSSELTVGNVTIGGEQLGPKNGNILRGENKKYTSTIYSDTVLDVTVFLSTGKKMDVIDYYISPRPFGMLVKFNVTNDKIIIAD